MKRRNNYNHFDSTEYGQKTCCNNNFGSTECEEKEFINKNSNYLSCSDCYSTSDSENETYSSSTKGSNTSACSSSKGSKMSIEEEKEKFERIIETLKGGATINDNQKNIGDYSSSSTNKKISPAAIKVQEIVLETEEDRKFYADCLNFLSSDSIKKVVLSPHKPCCKRKCLELISPNYQNGNYSESIAFSRCLRTELLARTREERASLIHSMLLGLKTK
jgi:hypothetical protein